MKRLLRWCAYLLLAAVIAVVGIYLAVGLSGAAKVSAAKERAAAELAEALPASKEQAVRDRDRVRRVVAGWGVPTYSWQELTCAIGHDDAGWIVQDYYQECRIRSIDLIEADESSPGPCRWTDLPSGNRSLGQMPPTSAYRASSHALTAADPSRSLCPDGILQPPRYGESRLVRGSRPRQLGRNVGWTVVIVETPVSRTVIGCDPWKPVFCFEPMEEPVMDS